MKLDPYEVTVPEGRESERYVYLRHNAQYTIALTNQGRARCDAEVRIDGREVGVWRVPGLETVVVERPVHDTGRFTFYEVGSREARKAGISESDQLGLLTVVFRPEDIRRILYASPDAGEGYAGGTGLSGRSAQEFSEADSIEYDLSQAVTIHLRLVGDPDEPRPMFQRETAVPPPVAPRSRDNQVNQSLENDDISTEKGGSGFTHLPTAEDRGTPRPQAPPPKHSLPPLPLRVSPQAIRHVSETSKRFTQEELLKIASNRESVVSTYLSAVVVVFMLSLLGLQPPTIYWVQLIIWAIIGRVFYVMAASLKEANAWWAFVAAFLPLVNLIMVFRLRNKATSVLKEHGVTISKAFKMRNEIRRMVSDKFSTTQSSFKNPQAHKGALKQHQRGMKQSDLITTAITLLAVFGIFVFLHYTMTVRPRQEAEKMSALSDIPMKAMQESQQKELAKIVENSNKDIQALFEAEKQKNWITKIQSDMAESTKQLDESKARLEAALSSTRSNNVLPNRPQIPESILDQVSTVSAPIIFDSTGHSKSNGIRFRISCPSSWKPAEGNRPHIIQKFTSLSSHESFIIQVLPVPSGLPDVLIKEDLDEIYSDEFYRECIPAGGRLLNSSRTKLDGVDCGMFETIYTTERAGIRIVQRTLNFIVVTKNGILILVGAAMAQPNETPSAEERFRKKPNCNLLVLQELFTSLTSGSNVKPVCSGNQQYSHGFILASIRAWITKDNNFGIVPWLWTRL